MNGAGRTRRQGGWSSAEAIAALAIVALALTASFSVIYRSRDLARQAEDAALRTEAAERVLERAVAGDPAIADGRALALGPGETAGRRGWRAAVRVTRAGAGLERIAVTVRGGGGATTLVTLRAMEGGP